MPKLKRTYIRSLWSSWLPVAASTIAESWEKLGLSWLFLECGSDEYAVHRTWIGLKLVFSVLRLSFEEGFVIVISGVNIEMFIRWLSLSLSLPLLSPTQKSTLVLAVWYRSPPFPSRSHDPGPTINHQDSPDIFQTNSASRRGNIVAKSCGWGIGMLLPPKTWA